MNWHAQSARDWPCTDVRDGSHYKLHLRDAETEALESAVLSQGPSGKAGFKSSLAIEHVLLKTYHSVSLEMLAE